MEKRWRSVKIIIDWGADKDKKEQRTLANFLNSHKIGPGEMIVLQKEFFGFIPKGQLVLDVMLYDIKTSTISDKVVLSDY